MRDARALVSVMARPLRLAVSDGVYHVTARGNGRRSIFADDHDRRAFLAIVDRTTQRFAWRCLSYCLMDNHVHLLLRTPQPDLPRGMQQLKSTYAQGYNRRHDRVGHLFAGRYGARLIQRDEHLLAVFRYIARNPVEAGLVDRPEAWSWSAHAALLGRAQAPSFLAVEEALAWFAGGPVAAPVRYAAFVADVSDDPPERAAAAYGDAAFLREILPARRPSPEIPVREWGAGRPSLDAIFTGSQRDEGIAQAYRGHGYSMADIAQHLRCHVCTVSRRLKAHEREMLECKI